MCLLSTSVVIGQYHSWATFLGVGTQGGAFDLEIWTRSTFFNNASAHQVSSSYVYSFRSYFVDKQTEILLKTFILLDYATPVEKFLLIAFVDNCYQLHCYWRWLVCYCYWRYLFCIYLISLRTTAFPQIRIWFDFCWMCWKFFKSECWRMQIQTSSHP